jgi:RimJ/RimL family protein N-acetyltransferase
MSYDYPENLKTDRLITKFLSLTDVMEWSLFFKHPESIRFLFIESLGLSSDEAVAQHMIQKQLDRYQDKRYGLQKLIHRESGLFIGCCGLLVQEVNGNQEVEVGYHIFPTYWGQGYATEAAKCFIDFAFNQPQITSVISIIDEDNVASIRVAEKNGLTLDSSTRWINNEPVGIYRIKRSLTYSIIY